VVKFKSKNFYIVTKMRQPDRRSGREVAFIAHSTTPAVQPAKPGGKDAWPSIRQTHSARPILAPIEQFRSGHFIARE
jgi:hypothetical protein